MKPRMAFLPLLLVLPAAPTDASPYTPLAWQGKVEQHAHAPMVGQRKHLTWVRDQNRNFIDDELEASAQPGSRVDVVVDLNRCLTPAEIETALAPLGGVAYVGKLITFVLLDQVDVRDLPRLAARPEVAMIEQRTLMNPEMDVASRAAEAHKSSVYTGTAEDLSLTGNGVVIAFMGTGITDTAFTQLAGKRVAGYDATDPNDSGNGMSNPPDTLNFHESVMAAIAVGAGVTGQTCRAPGTGSTPNCAGIAPGARYVNVRQCHIVNGMNKCDGFEKAADWVGLNATKFGIKVVNMAFSSCPDDDGNSAQAQQANFLMGMGLTVVAASSRNPANCMPPGSIGDRIVRAPGAGSFVLMVTASNDQGTVNRNDDARWSNYTVGPRKDFTLASINPTALKPDLAAPAQNLELYRSPAHLTGVSGTSPATGVVSGLAALILEKYPLMTSESVKRLLIDSADTSRNTAFNAATGTWDSALGGGLVRVGEALRMAALQGTDLTFPNCAATGSTSGQPCTLSNGQPSWNNSDISTATAPRVNVANTMRVQVRNSGANAGTATVNFGVMIFSAGNNQFHHIGSQQVSVAAGQTVTVSQPWTPLSIDHTCAQVSIAFGQDTDYTNNMTQRNLQIAASVYQVQVANPFFERAHFEVRAKSERPGWTCLVDQPSFDLDPFTDCPRNVTVTFNAPAGTPVGQQGQCQVGVYAQPVQGERKLIGGVTVVTYVPAPCVMHGQVVDAAGRPAAKARITLSSAEKEHAGVPVKAVADADGFFSLRSTPDVLQELRVQAAGGAGGTLMLRPMCGPSLPRVVVDKGLLKLDYLPPIVVERAATGRHHTP